MLHDHINDDIARWASKRRVLRDIDTEAVIRFFQLAATYTQQPDRTWFRLRGSTGALILGHLYTAGILISGSDAGILLIVRSDCPDMDGFELKPVKSAPEEPIRWAHATDFGLLRQLNSQHSIWNYFAAKSDVIYSTRMASDNWDEKNIRSGNKRLSSLILPPAGRASEVTDSVNTDPPLGERERKYIRWSIHLKAGQYELGLRAITNQITETQKRILVAQYNSKNRENCASRLAELAGITGGHGPVNLAYYRLAERFCEVLEVKPDVRANGKTRWWSVWSKGYKTKDGLFMWQMLPEVAEALENLGWVSSDHFFFPDESFCGGVSAAGKAHESSYWEGKRLRVEVNRYERSKKARDACIAKYETRCYVCEFDFGEHYGPLAEGFIHVHHLKALADLGEEHEANPIDDMRPVCPNCHAVIHIGGGNRELEEVREMIRRAKISKSGQFSE